MQALEQCACSSSACTMPTCSPARAASARPRCRASWPRASTAPAPTAGRHHRHALRRVPGLHRDRRRPLHRLHRARRRLQPRHRRNPRPARTRRLQAGHRPLQGVHDRRGAPAHQGRLQRLAEDAGRAARLPQVRARHHRPGEDAAHRAEPLPAVQPAADGARDRAANTCSRCCGRRRRRPTRPSLRLLARAARGSMRDALSLTDQAIAFGGGQLDEASVRAMLGAVDQGHAAALVEALAQRDGAGAAGAAGRAARAWACRPTARWKTWPCCCSRWRSSRPCPGRWMTARSRAGRCTAPGSRDAGRRDPAALQHRACTGAASCG